MGALTEAQKKTIMKEIIKGENGKVMKADLTKAKISALQAFVGEDLDCRLDFTRTTKGKIDKDGEQEKDLEISEEMECGKLIEAEDFFLVERDMLSNYDGSEKDEEGESILAAKEAKSKITI